MEYGEYQYLLFERMEDGILLVTINRPGKLNAALSPGYAEVTCRADA